MKGFSLPDKRSGEVVLEANTKYWDRSRFPRVKRIIFDNTVSQAKAIELLKAGDRRVDMVTGLSPLDTLKVAQSVHAKTVVGHMLEQAGFKVEHQILDATAFNQRVNLSTLDRPAEKQTWDIALDQEVSWLSFPPLDLYQVLAIDGYKDWVEESPEIRRSYDRVLRTVDRSEQENLIREMERLASDQAYFLFLYQPIDLVAVKKTVAYVPYPNYVILAETTIASRGQ